MKERLVSIMRLLIVAALVVASHAQCQDAGPDVDIVIPGWKDNAKCFELDYELDCHIYEAKLNCPKKCKRCVDDCLDGSRDITLDGLGNLFCSSIQKSYGDCAKYPNVSVYCPNTCGTCLEDGATTVDNAQCCVDNSATIQDNSDAIDTNRNNLATEEEARVKADNDTNDRLTVIEQGTGGGGMVPTYEKQDGALLINCDTTFNMIVQVDPSVILAPFDVVCQNNCAPDGNLWGTQPFSASSSVCAAAAIYGALEPYSADNEDTHVTVIPWTPVRQDYNGVERGPYKTEAKNTWEAGFLIHLSCPVLSINIDEKPIGYFFRNVNNYNFKQWVNHNGDNSHVRYFELNNRNYWRMQEKFVDWEADTCYASGKAMGARVKCETQSEQAACLATKVGGTNACFWGKYRAHYYNEAAQKIENPFPKDDYTILRGCTAASDDARASQCASQNIIDCTKLRGDNAEPLCEWAECKDMMYYSHGNGKCWALPTWAMECDGSKVQRHSENWTAWITRDPSAQVPMRLEMNKWNGDSDEWQEASLCSTTIDVACLEGALLECPGDKQVTTLHDDYRAQVDVDFPRAVMPGMEVEVLIDAYANVPGTFSAAKVEPGTQVLLPMKALTESTTYIMKYEGRDYLNNKAISECYIEIKDIQPPTFTSCPAEDVVLLLNPGSHQATIKYEPPAAVDNVDGDVVVECKYDNDQAWGLMDYAYTVLSNRCTAKDFSNNESVCQFNIIIKDEEAPVWESCNTDPRNVNMDYGKATATVNWQNAIPVATDAGTQHQKTLDVVTKIVFADGREEIIDTNRAIYQFPKGWTTVHFDACDDYKSQDKPKGNCAFCEFKVNVEDLSPPILDCPETQFFNLDKEDQFGNRVLVTYPKPTCEDNYDETCTPEYDFVQPFPGEQLTGNGDRIERIGSYTVQWSATDSSGNWAQCSFKVVLYKGCFTYKFEWNEWVRNDVAYVGLPCRGATSFSGGDKGKKKKCETDALYLDLSPTEQTDIGGKRYSVWENYFYDETQDQLLRDYAEVDPTLFGKWKLEFHMREIHHPYRMNQFTFYGELEYSAYGLQEWVWYDSTHVTIFVPIQDVKHTLKVTCADNILCPQVTPRTRSTEPVEVTVPKAREIGQRQNVACANGYYGNAKFGDGINFCCEADEDHDPNDPKAKPPHWNVCRNNSGECLPCNKPFCRSFRENTCVCEDCADAYFLTNAGECAPACTSADIIEKLGKRCDRGIISGYKLGEDVSECFCKCDEGWDVAATCDLPEANCQDRIDGSVDSEFGTLRTGIPEAETAKGSDVYVPCKSGFSGNLAYTCQLQAGNQAEWYYTGNTCAAYECKIKIADAGRSCNSVCWESEQMTCNAQRMNEANDFVQFRSIVAKSELGDSCSQNAASNRAYAPFVSESHQKWCYWQGQGQTQCNIPVDNENKRICVCCPGCLITGKDRRAQLHWDWIGSGNTFFEILDNPSRQLFCVNPSGFDYEPYNFSDEMYKKSCTETEEVQMPRLCEFEYKDQHWMIARRGQSCRQACDEIYTDDNTYYECDHDGLNTIYNTLSMRNAAIKAGEECTKYPPSGLSEAWYPAIEPSTHTCYYRYDESATAKCDTRPGNQGHRRLCACKKL